MDSASDKTKATDPKDSVSFQAKKQKDYPCSEMSEKIGPKEVRWDFILRKTKALPKEEKKSP